MTDSLIKSFPATAALVTAKARSTFDEAGPAGSQQRPLFKLGFCVRLSYLSDVVSLRGLTPGVAKRRELR